MHFELHPVFSPLLRNFSRGFGSQFRQMRPSAVAESEFPNRIFNGIFIEPLTRRATPQNA
jgi:hypothetical protein